MALPEGERSANMIRQATVALAAMSGMAVADGYAGRGGVWSAELRGA